MKTEILNKQENKDIDWGKPQWFIDGKEGIVVFTNGKHNGDNFEGTCLPCELYQKGATSLNWNKKFFKPIPKEGLTIKITNE